MHSSNFGSPPDVASFVTQRKKLQAELLAALQGHLECSEDRHVSKIGMGWPPPSEIPRSVEIVQDSKVLSSKYVVKNEPVGGYADLPSVALLPKGSPWRLITTWQNSPHAESSDGQIIRCAFSDDGLEWTTPQTLPVHTGNVPVWNPVVANAGEYVFIFYSESVKCKGLHGEAKKPAEWHRGGDIKFTKSKDGITWTRPAALLMQGPGAAPYALSGPPIIGDEHPVWILPVWRQPAAPGVGCGRDPTRDSAIYGAGVLTSSNGGRKWEGPLWQKVHGQAVGAEATVFRIPRFPDRVGMIMHPALHSVGAADTMHFSQAREKGQTWSITTFQKPAASVDTKMHVMEAEEMEGEHPRRLLACYGGPLGTLRVDESINGRTWSNILTSPSTPVLSPSMVQLGNRVLVVYASHVRRLRGGLRVVEVELPTPADPPPATPQNSPPPPSPPHPSPPPPLPFAPPLETLLSSSPNSLQPTDPSSTGMGLNKLEKAPKESTSSLSSPSSSQSHARRLRPPTTRPLPSPPANKHLTTIYAASERSDVLSNRVHRLARRLTPPHPHAPLTPPPVSDPGETEDAETATETEGAAEAEDADDELAEDTGGDGADEDEEFELDLEELEELEFDAQEGEEVLDVERVYAQLQNASWGAAAASFPTEQCWDARDSEASGRSQHPQGVLQELMLTRSKQLQTRTNWISKNTKNMRYQHMAMLGRLPTAAYPYTWLAVWQASSSYEGQSDQHLECAYSSNARDWDMNCTLPLVGHSELVPMRNSHQKEWRAAQWSPVLFYDEVADMTWLFYTESTQCLQYSTKNSRTGYTRLARWGPGGDIKAIRTSDGVTWSPSSTLYKQSSKGGIPKVIANQMIVTRTGEGMERWVLPFWLEPPDLMRPGPCTLDGKDKSGKGSAGVLVSDDRGGSWAPKGEIVSKKTWLIEGTVCLKPEDKSVIQYFRTQKGLIYAATSVDAGSTWGRARPTTLRNPNAKVNMINLASGELAIAFNDWSDGTVTSIRTINKGRKRLRVALSCDGGDNWMSVAEVEVGHPKFYFHYPTVIQDGQRLLVIYSTMLAGQFQRTEIGGGIKIAEISLDITEKLMKP
ncbi:hypothetical protein CYMTET_31019 [Cymbomonas tetramitiformis]|uniref:Sialidase domain-containing protein n=1 Tax=Cymbomonas tetramitiformis TaxID=36881 RepID=A0AAE0FHR8_9CHLO|nr:hypothetical protein CYMTET_31019 [Cymbomonas tetramitiformis]